MKFTLKDFKKDETLKNTYNTEFTFEKQKIQISIDPDDGEIEKTLALANNILSHFSLHEANARKVVIDTYLDNYNENWADEEDGFPKMNREEFSSNLSLYAINFLSDSCIDFFYDDNGMYGNHSLIGQSFDGENFDDAMMYG